MPVMTTPVPNESGNRTRRHLRAIEKALALTSDASMPRPIASAFALRDRLADASMGPFDVAGAVDRLLAAKKPDAELAKLTEEYAQREARAALLAELAGKAALARPLADAVTTSLPLVLERVRPTFDAAVADLTDHAGNLPESESPLAQAQRVLAAGPDAATAWSKCTEAAETIEVVAKALDGKRCPSDVLALPHGGAKVAPLLSVLAPPTVDDHERQARWTWRTVQSAEELEPHVSVRGFVAAVLDFGVPAALVRMARGEFTGWTFAPTVDAAELRARAQTIRRAMIRLPEPDPELDRAAA